MGQQEQRGPCWTGVLLPVVLFLGTLACVPELHVHLVLQRLEHKKRTNSYASCGWKSRRQAHCDASDKLHYPVISDPVFVSSADASWANKNREVPRRECCSLSYFLAHSHVSVARSSGSATRAQEENSYESCGWKSCKAMTTRQMTKKFPREVVSSLTRKVFLTQSIEMNLQLFPCNTKDRQ